MEAGSAALKWSKKGQDLAAKGGVTAMPGLNLLWFCIYHQIQDFRAPLAT